MKIIIFLILISPALLLSADSAAQSAAAPRRCMICEKLLGAEVSDSLLSGDPDFQRYRMFQRCRDCLQRGMSPQARKAYERTALKYKWSSINHNVRVSMRKRQR